MMKELLKTGRRSLYPHLHGLSLLWLRACSHLPACPDSRGFGRESWPVPENASSVAPRTAQSVSFTAPCSVAGKQGNSPVGHLLFYKVDVQCIRLVVFRAALHSGRQVGVDCQQAAEWRLSRPRVPHTRVTRFGNLVTRAHIPK